MSKGRKPFYSIINKSATEVDLLIYGVIGGFNWDTWQMENTDRQLVTDFKALEDKYDRINVHINSPGGSVWDGLPFINAIARSKKEVHTYNDGIAYSMGAMILLAPPKKENIHAAKNSLTLLHCVQDIAWTNAKGMREAADMLDKYDQALSKAVCDLTGMKEADVLNKWFDGKDHLMTAADALKDGLIGNVEDYSVQEVPANIRNMSIKEVFAFYAKHEDDEKENFIDKIVNRVKQIVGPKEDAPQNNYNPMKLEKTLAALKTGATAEERLAAIAEVEAFTGANEKFNKTELDAALKAESDKTAAAVKVVQDAFDAFKKDPAGTGKTPEQKQPDNIGKKDEEFLTDVDKEARAMVDNYDLKVEKK